MIEQFHFLRPAWLLLLLPFALLLWRLLRAGADSGSWRRVIDARLLPFVLDGNDDGRRGWMRWLFVCAALLGIVALAGPTWEKLPRPVYHKESALVIALDLSRSMNAADIKPSRLARARHKVADILNLRTEGQTALLVYAADAFTVTPLTSDVDTILALLPVLESGMMPTQGTRADRALGLAFELFENSGIGSGDVLLISDGLSSRELERIEAGLAARRGHRLSVLAIGTPEGGPVPLADGGFLKDRDGAIVISELREDNLRRAARLGGGVYATISTDDIDINTLAYLLESSLDQGAAREADYAADLWRELGPGLLLFALPFAALAFRRGLIWMLPLSVLALPPDAGAFDWQALWQNDNQRAGELFENGEHAAAAELFEDPAWRASSSYRAGDYDAALETWQGLAGEDAIYNRGNALARLGRFDEALEAYDSLLRDNPGHADALYNKQAIEKFLQQPQQAGQEGAQSQPRDSQNGQQDEQRPSAGQQGGEQQGSGPPGGQQPRETREGGRLPGENRQTERDGENEDGSHSADSGAGAERQSSARQAQPPGEDGEADAGPRAGGETEAQARLDRQMSEQAAEQWLRKIPDDPGGLLRRKFLYQYRKRGGVDLEGQPW